MVLQIYCREETDPTDCVVGHVSLPQLTVRETEAQGDELSSPQQILVCNSLHLDPCPLLVSLTVDLTEP